MVGGFTSVPKIMLGVHRRSSSICIVGKPPFDHYCSGVKKKIKKEERAPITK
jgi:hypothetical protein